MIVKYSMFEDFAAGFRENIFLKRWRTIESQLSELDFSGPKIRARLMIRSCEPYVKPIGMEGESFVVEHGIPISTFRQLSIADKNEAILHSIYLSIEYVFQNCGITLPVEIKNIFGKLEP